MSNTAASSPKPTNQAAGGHKVVSREAWLRAREELLTKEKRLTHQREVGLAGLFFAPPVLAAA